MKRIVCLAVLYGVFLTSSQALAQPAAVQGSLDELIDWNNPWGLTPDKFMQVANAIPRKQSIRPYDSTAGGTTTVLNMGGHYGGEFTVGKFYLFGGRLRVDGVRAEFEGTKLVHLQFCVGQPPPSSYGGDTKLVIKSVSKEEVALLRAELSKRTGDTKPRLEKRGNPGEEVDVTVWQRPGYYVQAEEQTLAVLKREAQKKVNVVYVNFFAAP